MTQTSIRIMIAAVASFPLSMWLVIGAPAQDKHNSNDMNATAFALQDDAVSARAFESIVPVLRHPRCMNCHSKGDTPRQGDDSHNHTMKVRRGPDGNGIAGAKCSSCHQRQNLSGPHMPPGAAGWHLPPPQMPMIWEGLTDRQVCELLKDPAQNGGRNVDQLVEHMKTPLVQWGWNPGEGRTPIAFPQDEFFERCDRLGHARGCLSSTLNLSTRSARR